MLIYKGERMVAKELEKEFANLFNEVGNKRNGRAREVANLANEVKVIKIGDSGFIVPLSEGWIKPSASRKSAAKVKIAVIGTGQGIKVVLLQKDRVSLAKKINGIAPPATQAELEKYLNEVFAGLKSVATVEETLAELKRLTGAKPSQ